MTVKRRFWGTVITAMLWFLAFFPQSETLQGAPFPAGFHPTRLIIQPKRSVAFNTLQNFHRQNGVRVLRHFNRIGGLEVLSLPPGQSPQAWAQRYLQSGLVNFAEPDFAVAASVLPNDPKFADGTQWDLHNTGQNSGKDDADIDAPEGWAHTHDAPNVIVAVVDTGVNYNHEDLSDNLWRNPGEIPGNGIDDDNDGYVDNVYGINAIANSGNPLDDNGHGTHVAGTIGAVGNNGKGVAGVAWKVQIMGLKCLGSDGSGLSSDSIECIDFAVAHGARVINASWGGTNLSNGLRLSIDAARAAGVIFVAAAGNDARDIEQTPTYPAAFDLDNIIAVAATDRNDQLDASYSNYGAVSVDLGAPGTRIYSCWHTGNSAYQTLDGTSMATPHVAGACALVCSRYPGESYRQIIGHILNTVDPLPSLQGKCVTGGRLNLDRALGLVAKFSSSSLSGPAPLAVNFTNQSAGTYNFLEWDFGDGSPRSHENNPSHVFRKAGDFPVSLTIQNGLGDTGQMTRFVFTMPDYQMGPGTFSWIDPTLGSAVLLVDDEFSEAISLPFDFQYYGHYYNQLFIGANGLLGFSTNGLDIPENTDLPTADAPNGAIYPYWDDLIPASGGAITFLVTGEAPNRKAVASWINVPPYGLAVGIPPTTRLTFQVVLSEGSNEILFQYQSAGGTGGSGSGATIGIEHPLGVKASRYAFNGSPAQIHDGQAILFRPTFVRLPNPAELSVISAAPEVLSVAGDVNKSYILQSTSNFSGWAPLVTNSIPASGFFTFTNSAPGGPVFFRAVAP